MQLGGQSSKAASLAQRGRGCRPTVGHQMAGGQGQAVSVPSRAVAWGPHSSMPGAQPRLRSRPRGPRERGSSGLGAVCVIAV